MHTKEQNKMIIDDMTVESDRNSVFPAVYNVAVVAILVEMVKEYCIVDVHYSDGHFRT